ncbi:MAG: hypothetical protein IEMM0008_1769 [bacterium]|nr:MAG: hypothetical protein IEMM0008_1769 [bacterium]
MKRITFIIALVFMTGLAFSNLKETQSWLKKHGRNYTINQLKNLKELDLSWTDVSDLTPLKSLTNLEELNLSNTQVIDITPLYVLEDLKKLVLFNTKVSHKDVLTLKKILPKCKIYSDYK